jgi:O-antigen/teichoic acid export membrane protein
MFTAALYARRTEGDMTSQGVGSRRLRAAAAVTIAGSAVNALAYAVPLLGARTLAASELGALAAALAVAALASVVGLGLQTAVAVRQARHGGADAGPVTVLMAALTGVVMLAATPILSAALHLSVWVPPLLAVTTVAIILGCRWLGELQGARQFTALAWGVGIQGAARYLGIVVGLAAGADVVVSIAIGAGVAWLTLPLLAWLARHRPAGTGEVVPSSLGRSVVAASGATLAMLAVANADLILARHYLSPAESGAYAVGSVLTKVALWAPAVVTVLALPRLASGVRRTLPLALAAVAASGLVVVAGTLVMGGFAVRVIGGPDYANVATYAPVFAAIGGLYALAFVFINARIAAGTPWSAAPLWIALAGLVVAVAVLQPLTVGRIVSCALVAAAASTVALAGLARWQRVVTDA